MSDYAFTEKFGHEVERRRYEKHRALDYKSVPKTTIRIPPEEPRCRWETCSSIEEYEKYWRATAASNHPIVRLQMCNVEELEYGRICDIDLEVDTGAWVTVLSAEATEALRIDRAMRNNELPHTAVGVGGQPIAGLRRFAKVFIGKVYTIPVLVPPLPEEMKQLGPVYPVAKFNLLGRAQIIDNFLICFDARRFYAFPKVVYGSGS